MVMVIAKAHNLLDTIIHASSARFIKLAAIRLSPFKALLNSWSRACDPEHSVQMLMPSY
ncbi:Hypothetical predicted protein [Podarcis lilfordi]|uniref:Uncharacterized protein n=1 Tax=Podarcis lilfordi TaxID=74358 RepID=A0AA35PEL7_9SAUR|nr:Hypothetical predicted protein [Podarcis lilfordi]